MSEFLRRANAAQKRVAELEAEVERLLAELAWCHGRLTDAHEELNPGVPLPNWHTVYESLKAAKRGDYQTTDEILADMDEAADAAGGGKE